MLQFTLWSLPPIIACTITLVSFIRARGRDEVPGSRALRFLFVALIFWCAAQAVSSILTVHEAKLLASQIAYIGIALTPVAWFLFALTYSQRVVRMSRKVLNVVSIVPTITVALALSNSSHRLMWESWQFVDVNNYTGLITQHGFWFYVHAVYSYGLVLVGSAILVFCLTQAKQHKQSLLAAIFAPLVCVLANLFYLSPFNPSPWLDLTTLGFAAGVLILDRGILHHGLLNTLPVMRERLVEHLSDPVLVVNYDGTIVDANQSALRAWGGDKVLHKNVSSIVQTVPVTHLLSTRKNSEITIDQKAYEVASTVLDGSNPKSDSALVFRDVTARRDAEHALTQLKNQLERMAHTDGLTGFYNRRYFMQRLQEEFERVHRHGGTLSVVIYDLDHFKRINDTHGHDAGDDVLRAMNEIANRVKRVTDIAARLGGEEFALLLPETDKIGAINLAQRLRHAIEGYPFCQRLGLELQVTASIGVATLNGGNRQPEDILSVADQALYRAKNGGRNQVCMANDT